MVTRRHFLAASAATVLLPAMPAKACPNLSESDLQGLDDEFAQGLSRSIWYGRAGTTDIYEVDIDFGLEGFRAGERVMIWSYTDNPEAIQQLGGGKGEKKLVLFSNLFEELQEEWWRHAADENGIRIPETSDLDRLVLPDFTWTIFEYLMASKGGIA